MRRVRLRGADKLKSAMWWLEFNSISGGVADIDLRYYRSDTDTFYATGSPGAKTLKVFGTKTYPHPAWNIGLPGKWTWQLLGTNVPTINHPVLPHNSAARQVILAHTWEDLARDDADGPAAGIQ